MNIKRFFTLISLMLFLLAGLPAIAQEPVPVDELPPLKLPPLPGEGEEDEITPSEQPDIPPPPEPLPLPEGEAKVAANIAKSGQRFYKLMYDGKLVGYSAFHVSGEMSLGGDSFIILQSEGEIKLGFGTVLPSTFYSKLMLDKKDLRPSYFKCIQKTGGGAFEVECVYSDTMVAQTNKTGDNKTVHFHNYEERPPSLLFNNLWGHIDTFPEHYWVLARSAIEGGILKAYDPILRGGGELVVYQPKHEEWEWIGRKLKTRVYPISDLQGTMLAHVRLNSENLELMEVVEVGSGLTMIRSTPEIVAKVKKSEGVDLLPDRVVDSNVVFPDPEKLTSLEADVEISLRGGQFADHRIPGYRQYFTGDLRQGYMKGKVVVRSVPRDPFYTTKYPIKEEMPPEVKAYTKPGPGVESEHPALQIKARELAWKAPNTFEAARRLMNFTSLVEEGVSLPSARYAFESGVGNPESKALLMIAMARAVNLPARPVGGLLFRDGSFVPHHWAEVWLGPTEGWAPFDPTTGEAGRVGASHIALWESGDVQTVSIKVTDYAPRAANKVPYFAKELTWGVGERRTYGIFRDGQKVGEETATIKDLIVEDGQEVYKFSARSEIEEGDNKVVATAQGLLDPSGLPVKLEIATRNGSKEKTKNFQFNTDTLRYQEGKDDEKPLIRDIPFAKGTYVNDPHILTQWALMVGQLPRPAAGVEGETEFSVHVFLPDSLKSEEMVLMLTDKAPVVLGDGNEIQAQKVECDTGMTFFLNDQNQVVKIAVPEQNLELVLQETKTEID